MDKNISQNEIIKINIYIYIYIYSALKVRFNIREKAVFKPVFILYQT